LIMAHHIPRICVVGSANIDLTFRTHRLPRPGETIAGEQFQLGFGGKGANQAVMAARLGAQVAMIAKVGGDVFGVQYLTNFRACGIDTTHVLIDRDNATGAAAIVVDGRAENCIIVVGGANHALTPADVQQAAATIRLADMVLGQLEVPLDATLEAFRIAKSAGVRTILNPAPAQALPDELLRLTDVCVLNEIELEMLAGQPALPCDERNAIQSVRQRGPTAVVLTLGAEGTAVFEGEQVHRVPGIQVAALDTTGAGDAFIGSMAVFWAEGCDLAEAARRANAVAALTVTRPGAQASFPTRQEVDALRW
jgi:ribokinase